MEASDPSPLLVEIHLQTCFREGRLSRRALPISLLVLLVAASAASYVAYHTLAMWVNFVPVLLGVIIHHGFELAHVNRELRRKNSALAEKLKARLEAGASVV